MRRRLRRAGVAVVLLWAVACGFLLVRGALDVRAGREAAAEARDRLGARALTDGSAASYLRTASSRFASAESSTGNVLLAPVRILPIVGRQVRSVNALADAAGAVATAGLEAVERAQVVLDEPAGGGPARVDQVRAIRDIVREASDQVASVDDLGPRLGLVGPLAKARNELAEELAEAEVTLADARAGVDAALALVEGPRTYLLIAANNAEMRSGSGMWLSGGTLETAAGRLDLGDMEPLYLTSDPPDDAVQVEDPDLAARWGWMNPQREWRSLMASPRVPASAPLAARMWEAAGNPPVDGVLVVDPVALAAVVEATGPVTVGDERVDADEIPELLLHDQYDDLETGDDQDDRREALGAVASAAFDALDEGDWSPGVLVDELADAARGRHLLAWSPHEDEQAGWEAAGIDGTLTGDSLMVSVLNRGGNKLDWFLDVEATLTTEGDEVAVRVDLENDTPKDESSYVAGPHPLLGDDLTYGDYKGIVAFTVPGDATDVSFDGRPAINVKGPDGPTQVYGVQLVVPRGEEASLTIRFRRPDGERPLVVEASGRHPATEWRHEDDEWKDSKRRTANR